MSRVTTLLTTAIVRPMAVEFARQIGAAVRERLRRPATTVAAAPRRAADVDAALRATLGNLGFTAPQVARATRAPAVRALAGAPLEARVRAALRVLAEPA